MFLLASIPMIPGIPEGGRILANKVEPWTVKDLKGALRLLDYWLQI